MWYYLRWRLIRFLCARLFLKYSEQHVLQEWGDPVETFKETHVHRDLGRFVTYVVWLKQFPLAAQWYFRIEEQFGSQVLSCMELIRYWIQWGKKKRVGGIVLCKVHLSEQESNGLHAWLCHRQRTSATLLRRLIKEILYRQCIHLAYPDNNAEPVCWSSEKEEAVVELSFWQKNY